MYKVKKNTRDIEAGEYIYTSPEMLNPTTFKVIPRLKVKIAAQGPDFYGWENELGNLGLCSHEDVWVELPKTKLSQFLIGEKFKLPKSSTPRIYEVTAIGEKSLLAKIRNGDGYPFSLEQELEEI